MSSKTQAIIGLFVMLAGIALGYIVPWPFVILAWLISAYGGWQLGYNLR